MSTETKGNGSQAEQNQGEEFSASAEASQPEGEKDRSKEKIERLEKELLYMRAEFDNYRKRILREQDQAIRQANKNLVTDLLPVVDLFDKALTVADSLKEKGNAELKSFVTGIQMTRHELTQLLGRFGVELVGTVGEKFDPEKHEAISQQEALPDQVGKVLAVAEKGCLLNGKLLKPARVVVGEKAS